MAAYQTLPHPPELENPRWYCPSCGKEYPVAEVPSYPRCTCGDRCRFVTADNLPYAGADGTAAG